MKQRKGSIWRKISGMSTRDCGKIGDGDGKCRENEKGEADIPE